MSVTADVNILLLWSSNIQMWHSFLTSVQILIAITSEFLLIWALQSRLLGIEKFSCFLGSNIFHHRPVTLGLAIRKFSCFFASSLPDSLDQLASKTFLFIIHYNSQHFSSAILSVSLCIFFQASKKNIKYNRVKYWSPWHL